MALISDNSPHTNNSPLNNLGDSTTSLGSNGQTSAQILALPWIDSSKSTGSLVTTPEGDRRSQASAHHEDEAELPFDGLVSEPYEFEIRKKRGLSKEAKLLKTSAGKM
ncbi:hypothetical protein E2562_007749 [Oryza meyeriana var. granulata]|uniref:Uncharacterized protein n=1 Tax=Oryza meyeriana var. granulata TaxID=110450 RepID=A0A6G1EGJ0_9ORYZ|nr:hypothetical protein E2562_007749 [Oryza meyeriana var. granulata]